MEMAKEPGSAGVLAPAPLNPLCRIPRIGGRQVVEVILDAEVRSCTAATRAKPDVVDPVSKHNFIMLGNPHFEKLRRCCVLDNPAQFLSSQRPVYGRQVLNTTSETDAPLLCWYKFRVIIILSALPHEH